MMTSNNRAVDDCLFFKEDFPLRAACKAKPEADEHWLDKVDRLNAELRSGIEEKRGPRNDSVRAS